MPSSDQAPATISEIAAIMLHSERGVRHTGGKSTRRRSKREGCPRSSMALFGTRELHPTLCGLGAPPSPRRSYRTAADPQLGAVPRSVLSPTSATVGSAGTRASGAD